jgi:hypothetical protein
MLVERVVEANVVPAGSDETGGSLERMSEQCNTGECLRTVRETSFGHCAFEQVSLIQRETSRPFVVSLVFLKLVC